MKRKEEVRKQKDEEESEGNKSGKRTEECKTCRKNGRKRR
jgi:hypothetical protein